MDTPDWDAFVSALRADQAKLRDELRPYKAGTMHVGRRPANGQWEDITQRRIADIEGEIASIEKAIEFVTARRKVSGP